MDNVNVRVMGIFYLSSVVTRTFSRNGKKKVFHFSGFPLAYVKMLSSVEHTFFFLPMVFSLQFFITSIHFVRLNYYYYYYFVFQVLTLIKSVISEG